MSRSLVGWVVAASLAIAGGTIAYVLLSAGGSGVPSTELTTPEPTTTTTNTGDPTTSGGDTSTTEEDTASEGTSSLIDSAQTTASVRLVRSTSVAGLEGAEATPGETY